MYVHVEVLGGRGSLANLDAHPEDQIIMRVGQPRSAKGVTAMPSTTIESPIVNKPVGIAIPDKLSDKIKLHITKHAVHRDLDKYQLRLYVLKHDGNETKWLGIVAFRLLSLTSGYVVERWVPMKPATVTDPGDLRLRVVVRDTEADAKAVLSHGTSTASHEQPTEGCCCDVCDPDFYHASPPISYFDFNDQQLIPDRAVKIVALACAVM